MAPRGLPGHREHPDLQVHLEPLGHLDPLEPLGHPDPLELQDLPEQLGQRVL